MLPASLKEAIGSYIEILPTKLRPTTIVHRPEHLRRLAAEAEREPEFFQLVSETERAFQPDGLLFGLREAVKNFFRRTGYYYRLYFDGEAIGLPEVFETFANAFGNKWLVRKRYLAPLTTVQLCAQSIRFREFEIRRFSSADLDNLLRNSIMRSSIPGPASNSRSLSHTGSSLFLIKH